LKAKVYVTLKTGVLDPQGKAVEQALHALGFKEVGDVRIGKYLEIALNGATREDAEKRVREMCEKLLANLIIEDYRLEIVP
jgi:phosphoribosylformylglycinamidine synthase